ncbi:MAG: hypothetical protein EA423_00490 [Phycisphaerales bacterium]|nr:MAG: hypothetical protein EA423_00490 [Phycisphaerales bacterium]
MLVVDPERVEFDGVEWGGVVAIAVDRAAARPIVEWTDRGPHPTFADAPEQTVTIRVMRRLDRSEIGTPRPGDLGLLRFVAASAGDSAALVRAGASAMVEKVGHRIVSGGRGVGGGVAEQTIQLVALSADGLADPLTLEAIDGGEA